MRRQPRNNGFSLLEMSIVLVIFAILGSGLLVNLAAQGELQRRNEATRQLEMIREQILGFALTHGRIPCPANPTLTDSNTAAGVEDCTRLHGVLPWVTLASPSLDPWGHRLTYYASDRFTGDPITPGGSGFTLDTTGNANILDTSGKTLASALPLVLLSHGANGLGAYQSNGSRFGTASNSEAENADADLTFILTPPELASNDDLLIWISADQLKARLVSAGRLP